MSSPVPLRAGRRTLLTRTGRRAAVVSVVVALAGLLALSLLVEHTDRPNPFDRAVVRWLFEHVGTTGAAALLTLTEPVLDVAVCLVVVAGAALRRRWDVVALVAIGPWLAVLMSSIVLKPIIDRDYVPPYVPRSVTPNGGLAFPSGHETTLAAVVLVLTVLLLRSGLAVGTKLVWSVVALVWIVLGALGLVRNQYHYASDTVGGLCVAVAVVLSVTLAIDALTRRSATARSQRPPRPRPRTPESVS